MAPFKRQITYSSRPNHRARVAHSMGDRQFRTYDTSALATEAFEGADDCLRRGHRCRGAASYPRRVHACSRLHVWATSSPTASRSPVEVADGESTSSIAQSLQQAGLVSSAGDFTKKVSDLGLDGSLQPGTYTLTGGMSLEDLAKTLSAGPGLSGPSVTIPEGLTLANIAGRVSDATNGRISADDFKAQASNASVYASRLPLPEGCGHELARGLPSSRKPMR